MGVEGLPKSAATRLKDWCGAVNLGLGCGGRSEDTVGRKWVSTTLESETEKMVWFDWEGLTKKDWLGCSSPNAAGRPRSPIGVAERVF
ncbi:hypothetical protein ACFX2I_036760 [Malus domestica]